ncbi:efflux transporter outer membrane subunit [Klebsiella quasivariicola]|uniref:efflux transporter outer membrane subunit n=1 Tax=Klebsiella quasivariicola TaxID=2026240 RepID=UPI0018A2D258|nr:efflux transporter outer membrane subunit [Klebsiella quasivariicola]MBF7818290.1 efflux transporter outer membrane subunit [Klebsiella quasivariicola]
MKINVIQNKLTAVMISALLAGCSLTPEYKRPDAPVAKSWSKAEETRSSAGSPESIMNWQSLVRDPDLRALIALSLQENRNLRQTLLNADAMRAQYQIQRADRLPELQIQGNETRQRTPADLTSSGQSGTQGSFQAGVGLTSFELDLFGRVHSLSTSAFEEYLATEYGARSAEITLVSQIIQAYLIRDGAVKRRQLAEQTLKNRVLSLTLISARLRAGTVSVQDYQDALGLAEQAKAVLAGAERESVQATNALVLLSGTPDIDHFLNSNASDRPLIEQNIAPGVPSDLLTGRPDIIAAEHRLIARNADIGAARAAFFPRISLTGTAGVSSTELNNLFGAGQGMWTFIPQISLPLFSGGRNKANLDLATVRKDAAVAAYEQTIQTAFREVSDALTAKDTLYKEEVARRALVESDNKALTIARARYTAGVDDYLRYLQSERNTFANELELISTATERQRAIVDLFTALGGGWQETQSRSGNVTADR